MKSGMMILRSMAAILLLVSLSGCFKEKALLPPDNVGIGQTAIIEMGPNYGNQFYYSLETNKVISSNSRFAYDLMFDCNPNSFYIWLNTAKFMAVKRTDKTDLGQVTIQDTANNQLWYYELGEFNTDSNAIGEWWATSGIQPTSKGTVYIVNLGVDENLVPLGYIKLKVNNFNGSSYSISFADVNASASEIKSAVITKQTDFNYRYFTFSGNGAELNNIEPPKADWDLCFTKYTVIFYDPYYLPYEVTGVLSNPSKVSAYLDSTVTFNDVQINDFNLSRLQQRRDAIGYEWKRFELGDYTTKSWYTFFIKTGEDKFYKLRFLDFKKAGVKGYPTFEYYRL